MGFRQDILKLYNHGKIDYIPMAAIHTNLLPLDEFEHGFDYAANSGLGKGGSTAVDLFGQSWVMTSLGSIPEPNIFRAKTVEEAIRAVPSDDFADSLDFFIIWKGWLPED
jgi:hypothetical protein